MFIYCLSDTLLDWLYYWYTIQHNFAVKVTKFISLLFVINLCKWYVKKRLFLCVLHNQLRAWVLVLCWVDSSECNCLFVCLYVCMSCRPVVCNSCFLCVVYFVCPCHCIFVVSTYAYCMYILCASYMCMHCVWSLGACVLCDVFILIFSFLVGAITIMEPLTHEDIKLIHAVQQLLDEHYPGLSLTLTHPLTTALHTRMNSHILLSIALFLY